MGVMVSPRETRETPPSSPGANIPGGGREDVPPPPSEKHEVPPPPRVYETPQRVQKPIIMLQKGNNCLFRSRKHR